MKGRHVPPVAFAVTLSACAASCGGTSTGAQHAAPAGAPATSAAVEVALVTRQALKATVPLPGELQPYESVPMFPKVNGFVRSIAVDRGSRVKAGQLIIRLEAPELVAQRAEAQAKLQSAQAQLAAVQARRASDEGTYQRLKAASATPGVVAGNDLEVSQRSVEAAHAQVSAQQDAVAAATQALQALMEVAGYLVEARWPVERPEPTLFVPSSAVASTLERTVVVRIAGGTTDWVDVRTGVATGGLTEVFGGLREGDQVAIRGTDELRPGIAVRPKASNP